MKSPSLFNDSDDEQILCILLHIPSGILCSPDVGKGKSREPVFHFEM